MNYKIYLGLGPGLLLLLFCTNLSCSPKLKKTEPLKIEAGVSEALAIYRRKVLSQVSYQISFTIPASKSKAILASETLIFNLKENNQPLQLDFKEKQENIQDLIINGKNTPVVFQEEHIILAPAYLKKGKNSIIIRFTAGNLSLNRNEDYLYTLLVPDR